MLGVAHDVNREVSVQSVEEWRSSAVVVDAEDGFCHNHNVRSERQLSIGCSNESGLMNYAILISE